MRRQKLFIFNQNVEKLIETLGKYLYSKGVYGYVTLDLLVFKSKEGFMFWAVDLQFGLSDYVQMFQFNNFLLSSKKQEEKSENSSQKEASPYCFAVPVLTDSKLSTVQMKNLVHAFRAEVIG